MKSNSDNDLTLYESDSESDSGSSYGQANAKNYTIELTTAQTSKKGRKQGTGLHDMLISVVNS